MSFGSVDQTIKKVKSDLKEAVKNNDVEKIFNYFGIENRKDADGFFTLSYYMQPEIGDKQYKFSSFGIDENKLVEKIKCIEEYGDFGNAQNLEFCNLETAGHLDFHGAKNINLKKLKTADSVDLRRAENVDLSSLDSDCEIALRKSKGINLCKLKSVGDINLRDAQDVNLSSLKSAWNVNLFEAKNINLSNLETALNVDLRNSKDIDLKNLEKVDGNILSLNAKNIKLDKWFVKSRFQVVYGS